MTDINGIVTGIQGNPISSATPEDGYVLTWSETYGYWVGRPGISGGLTKVYFTSSGTWICPEGITTVLITGCGGGSGGHGGGGGDAINGGDGGYGATQQNTVLTVSPGTTYTITIGAGGTGGSAGSFHALANYTMISRVFAGTGTAGESTQFKQGSTVMFSAIGAAILKDRNLNFIDIAYGGYGSFPVSTAGNKNFLNTYNGGSAGISQSGNYQEGYGGGGGGAGPQGSGGNGGNASSSNTGTAQNGYSAAANTGAGGGGGGGCARNTGEYNVVGGAGGNGGSGYLYIVY